MKVDIQMDYSDMQDAEKTFMDCASALEDLVSQVKTWSTTINDGALLGDAGEALSDALSTRLTSKIQALGEKCREEAETIRKSVETMQQDEKETAGYFRKG